MLRHLTVFTPVFLLIAPLGIQDKKKPDKKDRPVILYSMPLVLKAGDKQKVTLRGKGLSEVKEVKVIGAEHTMAKVLASKAVPPPNNYPADRIGDSEVAIELELPTSAKRGEVKLVGVGPGGESLPYTVLLRDELPAVTEKEPNNGFDQAQKIALPCAIEGLIQSERDVDVYQFAGKKGESLRLELQAARFGSPLDAIVTLYDADRRVVDAADTTGSPDPGLTVTLPRDGLYFVSVMDASDLGGPNFGYRLLIRSAR